MRKAVFILGCALITGGALALLWYGYLVFDRSRVQREANRILESKREEWKRMEASKPKPSAATPHAIVIVPPRAGEPVGRIEVPRLSVSVMVLEGDTSKILKLGAGHVRGTALPGTGGNICIAGHRDTVFRPLKDIHANDDIILTTSYGTYRYVVERVEIVDPRHVQVLKPTRDPELTLITCYPFYYAGSAPKRFIVHARQRV